MGNVGLRAELGWDLLLTVITNIDAESESKLSVTIATCYFS